MRENAGKLDKRIEILRPAPDRDKDGYQTGGETLVRRPWARLTRMSGTEVQKANADTKEVRARFLIRASSTPLDRKMVVRCNGDLYDIEYLNDYHDRHEYVELICKQRTVSK